MDSITKGQRNLLLFILGIAILVLPIRFLAMSNFDDKKSIESQYNERQTYYNSLLEKDANRQQYIADTEKYKADYEAVLAEFPSELYQDNTIMYLQGVKDKYKFNFPSVTMRRHFSIHLAQALWATLPLLIIQVLQQMQQHLT